MKIEQDGERYRGLDAGRRPKRDPRIYMRVYIYVLELDEKTLFESVIYGMLVWTLLPRVLTGSPLATIVIYNEGGRWREKTPLQRAVRTSFDRRKDKRKSDRSRCEQTTYWRVTGRHNFSLFGAWCGLLPRPVEAKSDCLHELKFSKYGIFSVRLTRP